MTKSHSGLKSMKLVWYFYTVVLEIVQGMIQKGVKLSMYPKHKWRRKTQEYTKDVDYSIYN